MLTYYGILSVATLTLATTLTTQIFLTWYCALNLYLYIEAYFRHKETDKGKVLLYK